MLKLLKLNKFWLNKAAILAFILVLTLNMPIKEVNAAWSYSDAAALLNNKAKIKQNLILVTSGDSLMGVNTPPVSVSLREIPRSGTKTIRTVLTAYSSTPDQTDDTPFLTASNTHVRDGIVAANFLAFGTKVQIPEIFGDKIFTVEDRMARKHSDKIDIWFPERHLAKKFGVQEAEVIVLQ